MRAIRLSLQDPAGADRNAARAAGSRLSLRSVPPRLAWVWLLLAAIILPGTTLADTGQAPTTSLQDLGIVDGQLSARYWIDQQSAPQQAQLDKAAIQAQNARLFINDPSMFDLEKISRKLNQAQVRSWIAALSRIPDRVLYDEQGMKVETAMQEALRGSIQIDAIPAQVTPRFGLVVHRADLRSFPTHLRVFSTPDDTDIDRFQESALFPGAPVLIIHVSADGQWWFVVSPTYAAWIEKRHVAEGSATEVFAYGRKAPFLVVTAATVRTTFTPELPQVSDLQLDMGVRVPLLADWPTDQQVNGQHPYTSHVIQLPVRDAQGRLQLVPALLPRTADVAHDYLPLTQANVIGQAFKFLGERYGWGHSYNTRDCSGFVSEVYRSMGVTLPRNTSDQARSPVLQRVSFDKDEGPKRRRAAVDALQVGDLVYIPGHVLMMIGRVDGAPYMIHDINGGSYLGPDGEMRSLHLNAVSVTPLFPLRFDPEHSYVDRITSIVRIRP